MTHFIAQSDRKPNAAEASHLRRLLREIDPELRLVVDGQHGAAPCWIEGPEYYGASHMREKRAEACNAFRSVLPPPLPLPNVT
jgi:hypothetical protein